MQWDDKNQYSNVWWDCLDPIMDVIHVLGFQINLISLGALDFKGFKCIIAGGVAKVVNGALVIMKGEMVRNLYRVMGEE